MSVRAMLDLYRHMGKPWQAREPLFIDCRSFRCVADQRNNCRKMTGTHAPQMKVGHAIATLLEASCDFS